MKQIFSRFLPLVVLLVFLAGCAPPARLALAQRQIAAAASAAQSAGAAAATTTVTSAVTNTSSTASPTERRRVVSTQATSTSTALTGTDTSSLTQAGTAQGESTVSADVTAAIKKVIQQANDEEQAAFAQHNATLMRDTATASYYQELVQTNRDMANSGVASIKLLNLQWGTITQQGSANVRATTNETWQTALSDGTVDQSTDLNVYTLVLQNGAWKISTDDHPNANAGNPGSGASGQPGTAPNPATQPAPLSSGQSHNWSGYAATGGTYTAVSGTWIVPQVAATSAGSDAGKRPSESTRELTCFADAIHFPPTSTRWHPTPSLGLACAHFTASSNASPLAMMVVLVTIPSRNPRTIPAFTPRV